MDGIEGASLPVHYLLSVYVAGEEQDAGALFSLRTTSPLPAPAVGGFLDPKAWPDPDYHPMRWGDPLTVVASQERVQQMVSHLLCERVLTVDWSPDPAAPDLVAVGEAERQKSRADFLSGLVEAMVPSAAEEAIEGCVAQVIARMKASPAFGFEDFGPSAWDEAAGILQADGHPLAEQVLSDVGQTTVVALKGLPLAVRVAAWLDTEPDELRQDSELWNGESDLTRFDPLDAWAGCSDRLEVRIVRRVVDTLRTAAVAVQRASA